MIETLSSIVPLISVLISPIVGVITWFAARRKRQLEGIDRLQKTIDMLVEKNCELTRQNIVLREEVMKLTAEINGLKLKNSEMSIRLEKLVMLENLAKSH